MVWEAKSCNLKLFKRELEFTLITCLSASSFVSVLLGQYMLFWKCTSEVSSLLIYFAALGNFVGTQNFNLLEP